MDWPRFALELASLTLSPVLCNNVFFQGTNYKCKVYSSQSLAAVSYTTEDAEFIQLCPLCMAMKPSLKKKKLKKKNVGKISKLVILKNFERVNVEA